MPDQRLTESPQPAFNSLKRSIAAEPAKDPLMALSVGTFFGPFGVGMYLESWVDFLVCVALVTGGVIIAGADQALLFWSMSGFWGAMRVAHANRRR